MPNLNVRQMFDRPAIPSDPEVGPGAFALITMGGDDGTRTHDPLLANTPDPDSDERLRLVKRAIQTSAGRRERLRTLPFCYHAANQTIPPRVRPFASCCDAGRHRLSR